TYYQGDINTVVDEHFFRALNKTSMPKDLSTKSRENRRAPKPFPAQSSFSPSWSRSGLYPGSSSSLNISSSAEEPGMSQGVIIGPLSADSWVYPSRQGAGYDLPPLHRQPAMPSRDNTSFLHLLHMERSEGDGLIAPSTKTDMQLEWTTGTMHLPEKSKDLYWF
uniref:Si:ch73-52f15.5 n=1 Tax=Astyanax mexicanus TaxID=7994 RepID=A0A3B1KIW8_ASTMX